MSFDVARVRGLYPTLGSGIVHLEGTYSALQPESVVRAIVGIAPLGAGAAVDRGLNALDGQPCRSMRHVELLATCVGAPSPIGGHRRERVGVADLVRRPPHIPDLAAG